MSELAKKTCVPCKGDVPPLRSETIRHFLKELHDWGCVGDHHLLKRFKFKDFVTALEFVNKVGEIAEAEGHHPDIHLSWGQVNIEIWTHKIDGLTESDFILAAKIDKITQPDEKR